MSTGKVRVLIVDDSALVREILSRGLSSDPGIEVVGTASDPYVARDRIVQLKPDVLTLDVEMPKMDGVEFLRKLMPQYPLPVLMVSALTQRGKQITFEAMEAGAVDFVTKPSTDVARGLGVMISELRAKVKAVSKADVSHWKRERGAVSTPSKQQEPVRKSHALAESTDKVIAIGASTGGTEAIRKVITALPGDTPGVVIVQHMPAGFTKMFAERLNEQSAMEIKEAQSGDRVMTGRVLIAPGDYHMELKRSGGIYQVHCRGGEKVCGHRPSVEVLFRSVAQYAAGNAIGVMLTGMGADGADGMVTMREAGARTMAQDEASSVVFGMPKEAYTRGGAEKLVPLDRMADELMRLLRVTA
ncbi:chemotaxis response regulator protein-glutamate methylesterase [bacterium]|nr:chemotaxis response regulator protein-glutamate methylesterase [bacterium]